MRSGQFTNEALVQRRQAARVCFATVALGLASLLTNMVRQVPDSPVALQKVGAAGPFILVAVMPRHLPPAYTRLVAVSMCIFIALDTRTTVRRWKETADEEAVPVRALRCAVPAINVLNAARVMMYTLWTNGSQFWFALRSANVSNSIARIVAVLLLKESDFPKVVPLKHRKKKLIESGPDAEYLINPTLSAEFRRTPDKERN